MTDTPATTPAAAGRRLPIEPETLIGNTRAADWALAFIQRFDVDAEDDLGLMLSWFANAIETGREAGVAAERQRIRQLAIDHRAYWTDSGWHATHAFADLLDGGGQDTP